jgi:hypothetical protein
VRSLAIPTQVNPAANRRAATVPLGRWIPATMPAAAAAARIRSSASASASAGVVYIRSSPPRSLSGSAIVVTPAR